MEVDESDWEDADKMEEADVLDTTNDAPMHGSSGIISVAIDRPGSKGKVARSKGPSKYEKKLYLIVHRSHILCLISRTHQLDTFISSDPCLQSTMLSLLSSDRKMVEAFGRAVGAQGSSFRLISCLRALTIWFRKEFTVVSDDASNALARSQGTRSGEGGEQDHGCRIWQKLGLDAIAMRAGDDEVLVAIFVALLRALGLSSRIVRNMDDALPSEPWKKVQKGKAEATASKKRSLPYATSLASGTKALKIKDVNRESFKALSATNGPKSQETEPMTKKRKGDEELERDIAMAIMSTGAEAEARGAMHLASSSATPLPSTRSSRPISKAGHGRGRGRASSAGEVICLDGLEDVSGQEASAGPSSTSPTPLIWAEVSCGSLESRWIHVDPTSGRVDEPAAALVGVKGGGKALRAHVMASEVPHHSIMDVTARYQASSSGLVAVKKGEGKWWEETLEILDRSLKGGRIDPAGSSLPSSSNAEAVLKEAGDQRNIFTAHDRSAHDSRSRDDREKEELKKMAEDQLRRQIPTSVDGFRNHPLFILKRHIQKYQSMQPGSKMLGMFKGEVYYERSELSALHTADVWRREGREVIEDEIDKPFKKAPKRKVPQANAAAQMDGRSGYGFQGRSSKGGGSAGPSSTAGPSSSSAAARGDEEVEEENVMEEEEGSKAAGTSKEETEGPQTLLYGQWQTRPWKAPVAKDGIVPKNDRGSVECPPLLKALPLGTVHLNQYPNLQPVCRALGVDFGPALVGWEVSGGRMLPRIDGVVICEEFEAQVVNACLEREVARNEAARGKREREAKGGWMKLMEALRMRTKLDTSYKNLIGVPLARTRKKVEVLTIESSDDEDEDQLQEPSESPKRQKRRQPMDDKVAVAKRLEEEYTIGERHHDQPSKVLGGVEREEI